MLPRAGLRAAAQGPAGLQKRACAGRSAGSGTALHSRYAGEHNPSSVCKHNGCLEKHQPKPEARLSLDAKRCPGRAALPGELSCGKREQGTAFLGLWLSRAGSLGQELAGLIRRTGRYFPAPCRRPRSQPGKVRRAWAPQQALAHYWPQPCSRPFLQPCCLQPAKSSNWALLGSKDELQICKARWFVGELYLILM